MFEISDAQLWRESSSCPSKHKPKSQIDDILSGGFAGTTSESQSFPPWVIDRKAECRSALWDFWKISMNQSVTSTCPEEQPGFIIAAKIWEVKCVLRHRESITFVMLDVGGSCALLRLVPLSQTALSQRLLFVFRPLEKV